MGLEFEWDAAKASANLRKHGVSFPEAATAFTDPMSITIADPLHSDDEQRYVLIGATCSGRLVVVAHVERGSTIRLVSARTATRRERMVYEE